MENYYTVIISQKVLNATKGDWVKWCCEYVGVNNFSWTIDIDDKDYACNTYVIRFEYEDDKLLFILNWA